MIETKGKYKFAADEHFIDRCTGVPWFNQTICQNLLESIFREFFITARQDRYDLICVL